MIVRLEGEFNIDDADDRREFDKAYYATEMAVALWDIMEALRMAEKNDYGVYHLIANIREIVDDLPESITG